MAKVTCSFYNEFNVDRYLNITEDTQFNEVTLSLEDNLGTINFDMSIAHLKDLIKVLQKIVDKKES